MADVDGVTEVASELVKVNAVAKVARELAKEIRERLANGIRKSDLEKFGKKIELLKCSIEEADGKLEEAVPEKVWVKRMREVAELIEDVFDKHVPAVEATVQRGFTSYLNLSAGRLSGTSSSSHSQNLAFEVEKIKGLLLGIQERAKKNDETGCSPNTSALHEPYICSSVEFLETTGRAFEELRPRILSSEFCKSTVAILGPGGIGKTVLANFIYKEVKEEFDLRVWVTVRHAPNYDKLLRLMLEQISEKTRQQNVFREAMVDNDERAELLSSAFGSTGYGGFFEMRDSESGLMHDDELVSTLRQSLQSKRYLVVFDDVWGEEIRRVVRDVLPDDNKGSRIIITTRSNTVAASYKETTADYIHRIKPLSEQESLDLFHLLGLSSESERLCYPEFEKLTLEIVRTCDGLPSAVVAIADVLSSKGKVLQEWRKLVEDFGLEVELDSRLGRFIKTLALSFLDLPSHLKQCFLYFSIIPRRSLVPNDQLYKLWIAEGFVQERAGKTLEEVAEDYLNELIDRNLVQECEGFYSIEKFSRVSGMMYEVARIKASERSFCQIWDGKESSFRGDSRRLSIFHATIEQVLDAQEDFRVRSVFISNDHVTPEFSALLALFERYKLITLLAIENTPIEIIPEELGNLICMKYLSLKNTNVARLPKTVSKLQRLQTLNLSGTLLVKLPIEISQLQNLRHLLASRCDNKISLDSAKGVRIEAGIGLLTKLQTLMTVEAHLSGRGVINELTRLSQLRRLSVSRLTTELARALCVCIEVTRHLKSLRLHSMNGQPLDLQAISSSPPHLEHLALKGLLHELPHWISGLQNVKMLCLSLSRLADDPLHHLCFLRHLDTLWLYQAYDGRRLHFQDGGFQSLKLLVLRDLQGLEAIVIEDGSLPLLEELRIGPSPLLNEVPSGINHLTNLKVISFYDMPNEFVRRMKPEEGLEYWKVSHIQSVFIWYRDEERRYVSYKLPDSELWSRLDGRDENSSGFRGSNSRLSFNYSEDEEDSAATSNLLWNDISRASFASDQFSFFTDDVEE